MATGNIARSVMQNDRPVIALHCSGAEGRQWRSLAPALGPRFRVIVPDLIGAGYSGGWCGSHAFRLIDEAQSIIEIVNELDHPVHLVGHPYGCGVALRVAADRPECVASLTLYEPSACHLLRQAGPGRLGHLAEIEALTRAVGEGIVSGAYQQAAHTFVDYWNGEGSWISMRADVRHAIVKWLPKVPLDFHALIMDDTPLESVGRIACPVLLLRGAFATRPSRSICECFAEHPLRSARSHQS